METGYMSEDVWDRTLRKIHKGSTVLPFWRGESTLHPEFCAMIRDLEGNDIVLATNGTKPDPVIEILPYLSVVNVGIHGHSSYEGYLKIRDHANGTKVIVSMVEGEKQFLPIDRIYKRHSVNGIWGKVDGLKIETLSTARCSRLDEVVIAWNGDFGHCCYVWDTSKRSCSDCDQWMGNGKTL